MSLLSKKEKHKKQSEKLKYIDNFEKNYSDGYLAGLSELSDSTTSKETKRKWVKERFDYANFWKKNRPKGSDEINSEAYQNGYISAVLDFKKEQNLKGLNIYGDPLKKGGK